MGRLVSACRFPPWTMPRAAHALSHAGQSAPPLFFARNRGEKPEHLPPRSQFGEPLDLPVQRRIEVGQESRARVARRSLRPWLCRLQTWAPCFAVRFRRLRNPARAVRTNVARREEVEVRTCHPGHRNLSAAPCRHRSRSWRAAFLRCSARKIIKSILSMTSSLSARICA